jgi:hypothetical protein
MLIDANFLNETLITYAGQMNVLGLAAGSVGVILGHGVFGWMFGAVCDHLSGGGRQSAACLAVRTYYTTDKKAYYPNEE